MKYLKLYKNKIILISCVLLSLCLFAGVYYFSPNNDEINDKVEVENVVSNNITIVEDTYTVEIKGAVVNPGVYKMKSNSRVIDVVSIAGGFTDSANTRYINLSKKISDEMSIIIYTNDEINQFKEKDIVVIEEKCECPKVVNDACLKDVTDNNLVSLNKATLEELITIPGIGESKAKSIIEYRNSKQFEKIEDIMNVKGIGESLFNAIKEYISI